MNIQVDYQIDQIKSARLPVRDHPRLNSALKAGRFSLHFLEMSAAMMVGMPILSILRNLIPANSSYVSAVQSGTILYDLIMTIFMTIPMVTWMIVRGHGWRHGAEMAFGMLAPVAAISMLRLLGADTYLPWLRNASHLAMPLGMLVVMLYRRDHYTGTASHSSHAAH